MCTVYLIHSSYITCNTLNKKYQFLRVLKLLLFNICHSFFSWVCWKMYFCIYSVCKNFLLSLFQRFLYFIRVYPMWHFKKNFVSRQRLKCTWNTYTSVWTKAPKMCPETSPTVYLKCQDLKLHILKIRFRNTNSNMFSYYMRKVH